MEGPSLVIATEEFKPFLKRKIRSAEGTAKLPFDEIEGTCLTKTRSWGKHFLLFFTKTQLRIHFLMFGSYRIDDPRPDREPKLLLDFGESTIYFYSCAIKAMPKGFEKDYDWSTDLMSEEWDPKAALAKIKEEPKAMVCDVLMDQEIFSGLGNIMKNEILYNLKMHPETRVSDLTPARRRKLVTEAQDYSWRFYDWKKENVLKRNWKIMRKKVCPRCESKVVKAQTGELERWSHYCPRCQLKR